MSTRTKEADVILNRANVALARSQRLIQSWLPQRTADDTANTKSEEELQKEEDELFKAEPEWLGVGSRAPQGEADGSFKRRALSSNDKLLEQLLGKKAAKGHRASKALPDKPTQIQAGRVLETGTTRDAQDSGDEDEGRARMIKSKNSRKDRRTKTSVQDRTSIEAAVIQAPVASFDNTSTSGRPVADHGASDDDEDMVKGSRKRGSYLDQVLAENAKKKKKKKKRA